MFVKYTINPFTLNNSTGATINIPIEIQYQLVDNDDLIKTDFINTEVANSINPILDYEKVRYIPTNNTGVILTNVNYNLYFLSNRTYASPTYYSTIGFTDDDLKYETNAFKNSFLQLDFYDSDNSLTQNLLTTNYIYSMLTPDDLYQKGQVVNGVHIIKGQPKPANQIPLKFVLSNPLMVSKQFYEGYHIYDYKDDVAIGLPKFLYMKASYFNGKNGNTTNLMVENKAYTIDNLVNKLYTKYVLYRDTTSFYYQIDTTYSSNVSYISNQGVNSVFINLFQIQAL
jgi:hypothetical protein